MWDRWANDKVEMVRQGESQKGGQFLVLIKGAGRRVSPRLHVFVSDVNQGNNQVEWVQDFMWYGKTLL